MYIDPTIPTFCCATSGSAKAIKVTNQIRDWLDKNQIKYRELSAGSISDNIMQSVHALGIASLPVLTYHNTYIRHFDVDDLYNLILNAQNLPNGPLTDQDTNLEIEKSRPTPRAT